MIGYKNLTIGCKLKRRSDGLIYELKEAINDRILDGSRRTYFVFEGFHVEKKVMPKFFECKGENFVLY